MLLYTNCGEIVCIELPYVTVIGCVCKISYGELYGEQIKLHLNMNDETGCKIGQIVDSNDCTVVCGVVGKVPDANPMMLLKLFDNTTNWVVCAVAG